MFRIHVVLVGWMLLSRAAVSAFLHPSTHRPTIDRSYYVSPQLQRSTARTSSSSAAASDNNDQSVETAIQNRHACKAYERSDGTAADSASASLSNPSRVRRIWECLNLARLAPTSFNTQPYKVVLVHSKAQKEALSQYCLSLNKRRVLDSECTAIFLADRQVLRTIPPFGRVVAPDNDDEVKKKRGPPPGRMTLLYIGIFSSGYPLPRVLAASISFFFRTAMGILDFLSSRTLRKPLPSLSNAETWTTKQTSMVAMTFMLACAAKGIATTPMEGINAAGIRRVIGAPRRYSIPLIVSAGQSAPPREESSGPPVDDDRRYAMESILFGDRFDEAMLLP
jgi:nitroreductase